MNSAELKIREVLRRVIEVCIDGECTKEESCNECQQERIDQALSAISKLFMTPFEIENAVNMAIDRVNDAGRTIYESTRYGYVNEIVKALTIARPDDLALKSMAEHHEAQMKDKDEEIARLKARPQVMDLDKLPKKKDRDEENSYKFNHEECVKLSHYDCGYNSALEDMKPLLEYVEKLEERYDIQLEISQVVIRDKAKLQLKVEKLGTEIKGEKNDLTAAYMAGFERGKDSVKSKVEKLEGAMREIELLPTDDHCCCLQTWKIVGKALKGE